MGTAMSDPVVAGGVVLAVVLFAFWRRTSRLQRRVSDFSVRLAKYENELQQFTVALAEIRLRVLH